jgi:hypothetical protein
VLGAIWAVCFGPQCPGGFHEHESARGAIGAKIMERGGGRPGPADPGLALQGAAGAVRRPRALNLNISWCTCT